jgi:hypothetical protein
MEQSPSWERDSRLANQKISRLSQNTKIKFTLFITARHRFMF